MDATPNGKKRLQDRINGDQNKLGGAETAAGEIPHDQHGGKSIS